MRSADPDAAYDRRISRALPYPDPPLRSPDFALRPFRAGDFEAASALGRDELGIGLTHAARGRGIGAASLRLFTDWVLATLDVGRVEVLVATTNPRALRLAVRAGYRQEAVLRGGRGGPDGQEDVIVLSRCRDEARRE